MTRRGKHSRGRQVHGILLFDKPAGLSSNQALQQVKSLYNAAKAGHTGSLDPLATGMLPLCFGEATKISAFLLDSDKSYVFTCKLGVKTTTGDSEGEVIERCAVPKLRKGEINAVLTQFSGVIEQIPPMFSALRHNGKRLYELARQGLEVERKPRKVTIHKIELLDYNESEWMIKVSCSKGTYIRSLAEDIGMKLNCVAHVSALRRISVVPFSPDSMLSWADLNKHAEQGLPALDQCLLPADAALGQWPDVHLTRDSAYYLKQGQAILVPHAPTEGIVRLYNESRNFIGLGQVQDDGKVAPKRLFFMD